MATKRLRNMTFRLLSKFDFIIVRFNDNWNILPATFEIEKIIELMSKDGTYQKCLDETLDYWGVLLKDDTQLDDFLMCCVRGTLADKLNDYIKIQDCWV